MRGLPVRIALATLFLLAPPWCLAGNPYTIRVVGETGRGVGDVRVIVDGGPICYTNPVGLVWLDPSATGGTVHLSIDPSYRFPGGTVIRIRRGGYRELMILH